MLLIIPNTFRKEEAPLQTSPKFNPLASSPSTQPHFSEKNRLWSLTRSELNSKALKVRPYLSLMRQEQKVHRGIYSISWQLQTAASTLFKDKRHPPVTFVLHQSVVKNTLCPPHLRAHTKRYFFFFRSCTTLRLCFLTEFFLHYYGSLHLSNKEITLK